MRVLVLHGPNLNLTGTRSPEFYGTKTLAEIDAALADLASQLGIELRCTQKNGEGEIIDELHAAAKSADAVILNPGAYAHYSYAIADAAAAIGIPVVEAHLSNIAAREEFRARSVVARSCAGTISGFGLESYRLALRAVVSLLRPQAEGSRGG